MSTTDASSASSTPRITIRCPSCQRWNRVSADRMADGPRCGACATSLGLDHPRLLDDDTFDRVVSETQLPVLVDFYADWCGPCTMMAPAVETLARESAGRAVVAKLDTDRSQRTAGRYQIRSIPTTILFVHGKEVTRQTGAIPLGALRTMIPSA